MAASLPALVVTPEPAEIAEREAAALESRHWLRLTRVCNQRCLFCLDSWHQDGGRIDTDVLLADIERGAKRGRQRLILSGGEPTLHRDFLRLVRHGREVGYRWIQVVTNGMLFAYPEFTRRALNAGLDEVTVSIHGHTAELHDRLVQVGGAFERAVQGIRNIQAFAGGRAVVDVDVVINRQNVQHLRDILGFFLALGVREFDLLHLVPFGRGFEDHREELFFDPAEHLDDLHRALELGHEPGVYIWTNRLPAQYLEGFEHLIQDPHKLHSEVEGTLGAFESFASTGETLDCHGERCDHCFLGSLCRDHLSAYRARLVGGQFERLRLALPETEASPAVRDALARQRPRVVQLRGNAAAVEAFLADDPYPEALYFAEIDAASAPRLIRAARVERVVLDHPEALEAARTMLSATHESPDIVVRLSVATVEWLLAHREALQALVDRGALIGELPNFARLSGLLASGIEVSHLEALRLAGFRLANVPACIGGERTEEGAHGELSPELLDDTGNLLIRAFVDHFIVGEYYTKSLRCAGCKLDASCRGLHVNAVRAWGFASLKPL